MKKLKYCYNNGVTILHSTYISKNTINKEKGDATKVTIYEINIDCDVYNFINSEKYITTLSLN